MLDAVILNTCAVVYRRERRLRTAKMCKLSLIHFISSSLLLFGDVFTEVSSTLKQMLVVIYKTQRYFYRWPQMLLSMKRCLMCLLYTHTHRVPAPNCTAPSLAIFCCVITTVTNIILFFTTFMAYCKMADVQFKHYWLCNNGDLHVALFLGGWVCWLRFCALLLLSHILCHLFALLASPANLDCPVVVVICVPSLFLMPFQSLSW